MTKHRFFTGVGNSAQPAHVATAPPKRGRRLTQTFIALLKEAQFTNEMLGSGATQIRAANYAAKGVYFQAFTGLSTGLERIGKLSLMLDYYIDHSQTFPDSNYMKNQICHNLKLIYQQAKAIITKRSFSLQFLKDLDDPIHEAIISVLSDFALGDRYSNIDLLVGARRHNDPVASWFENVDKLIYQTKVRAKRKEKIKNNAAFIGSVLGPSAIVLHTSEAGDEIRDVEEASKMTGIWHAVAPQRQLYVVQIIRYWVELLGLLQYEAMKLPGNDIPHFGEIFALFYNEDSYIKTRRSFDKLR